MFVIQIILVKFSARSRATSLFSNETDWSGGNGQLLQYSQNLHYMDFFNILQLALDTKRIIAGDEADNKVILQVKMFAEHL